MAIINNIVKKTKKSPAKVDTSYENNNDIKKLKVYVVIVNHGTGKAIVSLLQRSGSPAQYVTMGNGTATKNVRDILGIEDTGKDVVFALLKEELIPDLKNEVEAFFQSNKRNRGIGFSINMTGIIGVRFYRFIADVL